MVITAKGNSDGNGDRRIAEGYGEEDKRPQSTVVLMSGSSTRWG